MHLPFTRAEFFDVFARYNEAVWPMQLVLVAAAVAAVGIIYTRTARGSGWVSWILAVLWAWMGLAYHLAHFAAINPVARIFGGFCLVQAGLLAWNGRLHSRLSFDPVRGPNVVVAWTLIAYALVIYPLLGLVTGQAYMESPTFGAPCPTTIFTFGVLWFARRPLPRSLLLVPILWSAIGGSAAFALGVPQDFGLIVAGLSGVALLLAKARSGGPG